MFRYAFPEACSCPSDFGPETSGDSVPSVAKDLEIFVFIMLFPLLWLTCFKNCGKSAVRREVFPIPIPDFRFPGLL